MRDPGLKRLRAVLAVARLGSFRAAADAHAMSTSALSNAVAGVEQQLGVRLFNRTTRSVALTEAGRAFIAQVGPALQIIDAAMEGARAHQETPSGTLRINAFASAAREVFAPLISAFVQRYPQVHIDCVTEGRMIDIVAAGFDFGIRRIDFVPADMIALKLGRPRRHAVVASPHYFIRHPVPGVPSDLLGHACIRIRLPSGELYRWHFEKDGEVAQVDVRGPITLDEASLARAAVLEGIGIGYLMESDIEDDLAAGRMLRVLEPWTPPLPDICLYYPDRRYSSAAFRAFVELARDMAGAAPG
jgi:DNA-binding transcriptional LysR family regulator